jgi:hypothetical protein
MRAFLWLVPACIACGGPPQSSDASQDVTGAQVFFAETTNAALGTQPCGPGQKQGCYSNYVAVADLDGDGVLDLVFANGGDHFVPGDAVKTALYYGDGKGAFVDGTERLQHLAPSHVRQVAIGDVDGDGRLDLYLPGGYGIDADQLFIQKDDHTFSEEASARLGGRRSRAGGAHLGDVDDDGDLDLVVIDWGDQPNDNDPQNRPLSPVSFDILSNDGKGTFTAFAHLDAPDGSAATDVEFFDFDGDFDLDILLDNRNGQARLYLNDGKGGFRDTTRESGIVPKTNAISFNAEACDIDADGDLDLLFDGAANDTKGQDTQILVNDGKAHFADESAQRLGKEGGDDDNQVKCVDVDADGDFDLIVASLSHDSEKLFLNDGTGHFQNGSAHMPHLTDPTLGVDVGDFDGDGAVDYVTAQGENPKQPWLNRVFKNTTGTKDKRPPVFRAVQHPATGADGSLVLHAAITDAYTSHAGHDLREVIAHASGADGEGHDVRAVLVGGDMYRVVLPAATKTVTLSATDRAGNSATAPMIKVSE